MSAIRGLPGQRWLLLWLPVLVSSLLATPELVAPQAVRGTVVDDRSLVPVPTASVRLVVGGDLGRGVETDSLGAFFLPMPREGEYQLEVARFGYETARSQLFFVADGDTVSVEFRVLPDAVVLDPIVITGFSRRGRDAFHRRRAEWGRGLFLTPEQIDSIAPRYVAQTLEGLEKVHLEWGWGPYASGASGPIPRVRALKGRGCLLYMVDFKPVTPEPWASGHWSGYQLGELMGSDIKAVEVYRSVLEVPPELYRYTNQYLTLWNEGGGVIRRDIVNCGLVVFWTNWGW